MLGANPRKVRDLGVCEDSLARFDGDHNSSPRKLWTHLNFENADTVQKASSAGRFFSPFSMVRTASTSKTPIQVGPSQAVTSGKHTRPSFGLAPHCGPARHSLAVPLSWAVVEATAACAEKYWSRPPKTSLKPLWTLRSMAIFIFCNRQLSLFCRQHAASSILSERFRRLILTKNVAQQAEM
jgi:hypothetical protein